MHSSVLLDGVLAVRAGPSRAGHARSLMEGLRGTAIRSAVRDPSCPQAPVFARARRRLALVRGCSCRWLRPRPPIAARMTEIAEAARRVAHLPGWPPVQGPDLRQEVSSPVVSAGHRHRRAAANIPRVLPVSRKTSSTRPEVGMDPGQSGPAIFHEGSDARVQSGGGLPYPH